MKKHSPAKGRITNGMRDVMARGRHSHTQYTAHNRDMGYVKALTCQGKNNNRDEGCDGQRETLTHTVQGGQQG